MKDEKLPVVHCQYANEKTISEIVEESFRAYLSRIFAIAENDAVHYGQ